MTTKFHLKVKCNEIWMVQYIWFLLENEGEGGRDQNSVKKTLLRSSKEKSIYSSKATYKFFIRKKKLKTFEELENKCNPILLHTYW